MKKLISFRTLSYHCDKMIYNCYVEEGIEKREKICLKTGLHCSPKICPIWKRLEKVKGGER